MHQIGAFSACGPPKGHGGACAQSNICVRMDTPTRRLFTNSVELDRRRAPGEGMADLFSSHTPVTATRPRQSILPCRLHAPPDSPRALHACFFSGVRAPRGSLRIG